MTVLKIAWGRYSTQIQQSRRALCFLPFAICLIQATRQHPGYLQRKNAVFLVHDPSSFIFGIGERQTMDDHKKNQAGTGDELMQFDEFDVPTQSITIKAKRTTTKPGQPRLRQQTGMGAPREIIWNFDKLVVGGSLEADLCVAVSGLQDKHAVFEHSADQYRCQDISGGGLKLNGVAVHSCSLAGGDRVEMGDAIFLFLE